MIWQAGVLSGTVIETDETENTSRKRMGDAQGTMRQAWLQKVDIVSHTEVILHQAMIAKLAQNPDRDRCHAVWLQQIAAVISLAFFLAH